MYTKYSEKVPSPCNCCVCQTLIYHTVNCLRSCHPVICSFRHLVTWSLGHLVIRSLSHAVTQSLGHLVTRSLGHLVTWSVGHSFSWSLGHLVSWSLGHSVTQLQVIIPLFSMLRLTDSHTTSGSTGLLRRQKY